MNGNSGNKKHASDGVEMKLAFEYADYILYVYAIAAFIIAILHQVADSRLSYAKSGFVSFALIGAFVYMLARNYMVMRQIDDHENGDRFSFLNLQFGIIAFCERVLRLLIILIVIISPKQGYFQYFRNVVEYFSVEIRKFIFGAMPDWIFEIPAIPYYDQSETLEILPYYGTIIIMMFCLFLFWDLVCVIAISLSIRKTPDLAVCTGNGNRTGSVNDGRFSSFALYANFCEKGDGPNEIVSRGNFTYNVIFGNIDSYIKPYLIYLFSPKILERIFGVMFGYSVICLGSFEFSFASTILITVSLIGYVVFVSRNNRPFLCIWDFLSLSWTYPLRR